MFKTAYFGRRTYPICNFECGEPSSPNNTKLLLILLLLLLFTFKTLLSCIVNVLVALLLCFFFDPLFKLFSSRYSNGELFSSIRLRFYELYPSALEAAIWSCTESFDLIFIAFKSSFFVFLRVPVLTRIMFDKEVFFFNPEF